MSYPKNILLVLLILSIQVTSFSQNWESFQSQKGINDLVDTGTELMMATDAGLVVMNKTTLERSIFNKTNTTLSNNHIEAITSSPSGNSWIGTYDVKIAPFDGEDFQEFIIPEGIDNPITIKLYDLKVASNGDLWVGTSEGVFHREGQYWNKYDEEELGPNFFEAWDIEFDDNGDVFLGANDIYKFSNGVWSNISDTTELLGYLDAELFFHSSGDLYFGGDFDKIGRFDGENWYEYDVIIENGTHILNFTEDLNGDMYFTTLYDGVYKLIGENWVQQSNIQTEAFDNFTSYFYIDDQGYEWLNNNIHLSVNVNGNIQNTIISQHTIEVNNIYGINKSDNGNIYFISGSDKNISVVNPQGNWSFLSLPSSGMPFETFTDILYRSDNDIWLTTNHGYHHFDGSTWSFTEEQFSKSITQDSQGKVFILSSSKIIMFEEGITSFYDVTNSPITSYFNGHGVDANDNLWIAEREESLIHRVSSSGEWTTFSSTDHPAIDKPEGDFHFDVNGNVWVPLDIVGAIKFDGEAFSNPFEGNVNVVENYSVFAIESDDEGKLYFSHHYGVTTLLNGEWEDLIIEDVPHNYSHSSKMKFDHNGTLWWGSNRYGVFAYTTEFTSSISTDINELNYLNLYPNPASEFTITDFELTRNSKVSLTIYNNLGQKVLQKELGNLPSSTYQERLNIQNFPKGIYHVKLQIDDQIATSKLMIQ